MKKILFAAIAIVIIGAVVLLSRNGKSSAPAPQVGPAPSKGLSAEVIVVNDTTLEENISVLGTLYANEEVELASEVAGRLVKINFQEGQFVKKGQLLFKLDDSELQGRLRILEARRNFVNSSVARMEALYKAEAVSREEYENELNSLEVLDAEIDLIKVQIEKTGILAPFDGKTGIRRISQGAYVSPNTTLVNLEDMGDVKVEFAVPEKYSSKIRPGDKITFTVENNQRTYDAVVNVVDPKIDRTTRSLFVRAKADNPDFELVPGSSASIEVALGSKTKSLIVPSQSLIPNLAGYSVFRVQNGKAAQTSVTIGIRTNNAVQVTSGLVKGDTVMTTNLLRVKEGLVINSIVAND